MRSERLTVFVIDDDAAVRDSIALMLGLGGYRTSVFADAEAFLAAWNEDWVGLRGRRCAIAGTKRRGAARHVEEARRGIALRHHHGPRRRGDRPCRVQVSGGGFPRKALRQRPTVAPPSRPPSHGRSATASEARQPACGRREARSIDEPVSERCLNTLRKVCTPRKSPRPWASALEPSKCTRRGSWKSLGYAIWQSWCASPSPRHHATAIESCLAARRSSSGVHAGPRTCKAGQHAAPDERAGNIALAQIWRRRPTWRAGSPLGHDVDAAVDVQRFAGQPACVGRGEEGAGEADVHDVDQFAQRRPLGGLVEQQVEVLQARGGARLQRPRRDRRARGCRAGRARRPGSAPTLRARPSRGPSRCSW